MGTIVTAIPGVSLVNLGSDDRPDYRLHEQGRGTAGGFLGAGQLKETQGVDLTVYSHVLLGERRRQRRDELQGLFRAANGDGRLYESHLMIPSFK